MTQEQMDALEQQAENVKITAVVKCPEKGVIETEVDSLPWALYRADQAKCAKMIKEQFKPLKDAAHARHKRICAKETEMLASFLAEEDKARKILEAWRMAEERRRAEEQAKAEELARQEAVAAALAEGDAKLAKQIDKGVVPVSAPEVIATPVKIAGMSFSKVKKGKVIDKAKFIRACLSGNNGLSIELLTVDERRLNDLVKATSGTVPYAGVEIYDETQSRGTGR